MRLAMLVLFISMISNVFATEQIAKDNGTTNEGPVKVRWLVTHAPNDYFVKMAHFFKERVEARTQGRVQIEIIDDSGCFRENYVDLDKPKEVKALLATLAKSKVNSPLEKKYLSDLQKNISSNNFIVELKRYLAMKLLEEGKVDVSQHYTHFLGEVYNSDYLALEMPYLFMNYNEVEKFIDSKTAEALLNSTIESKGLRGIAYTFSGGLIDFISKKDVDLTNFKNWKSLKTKPATTEMKKMMFDYLHASFQMKKRDYKFKSPHAHRPTFLIMKDVISAEEINLPDVVYWLTENLLLDQSKFDQSFAVKSKKIAVHETQHSLISTIMMVRENVFNKLSEEDKKVFKQVAVEAGAYERGLTVERYTEAKNKLISGGYKWVEYSNDKKVEFKNKFKPYYDRVYKKYPNLKKVVEEIEANKNEKSLGVAAI